MDVKFEKRLESLGAFEVSSKMLSLAAKNEKAKPYLNAGRGNPNWINAMARRAFGRIVEFGVEDARHAMHVGDLVGNPTTPGIATRFAAWLSDGDEVNQFLERALAWCHSNVDADADELVAEFVNGAIGDNYPVPSRCLVQLEKVINAYLERQLYAGASLKDDTTLFATEGGTAAIVYIFESLRRNHLIEKGDKIAINTPIFTPYLQIPELSYYEMSEIDLSAAEDDDWHMNPAELDKLLDPAVKAFFLVNPSNPGARALGEAELDKLAEVIRQRPDLFVITDDVYGTFVDGFKTAYAVAPHNTLLVYSYSKLYGATGWRIGVIGLHKDNVFDRAIAALPERLQAELESNYRIVTNEPRTLPFIERLCADSRSIGLYHTSGLSTPQQVMMALFSLTDLVCDGTDPYIETSKAIVARRYHTLYATLGIAENNERTNSKYYTLIDVYEIAATRHGDDFASWLATSFEQIDFLLRLCEEEGVVLMEGVGFDAAGTLRVSEANLDDESYAHIAKRILELLDEYFGEYQKGAK